MKAKLTLLVIILSFAFVGQVMAQGYTPFDFKRSIWNHGGVSSGAGCAIGPCTTANLYCSKYAGETIWNGKRYFHMWDSSSSNRIDPQLFREDTINRAVYAWDYIDLKDTLVYDFNLRLGDTLKHCLYSSNNLNNNVYTVIGIDSVKVSRKYHRRFRLSPDVYIYGMNIPNYLIEGIGGSTGLGVSPEPRVYTSPHTYTVLTCFNGQNVTNTTIVGICDTIVSLKAQQIGGQDLNLKNPYLSQEPIKLPEDCKDISVFNGLGQQVPITVESANSIVLVRLSIPNSGMYWVNYSTSVGVFRKNVVVTQ
jgi:hypothetical protein